MRHRSVGSAVFLVLLSTIWASIACAENSLEMAVDRYEAPGSAVLHDLFMQAENNAASTGSLATPSGTYAMTDVGGEFRPEQDYYIDHTGMTFAGLEAAISAPWTLTWNPGAGQTVVSIDFGTILESEFLPIPRLTFPLDGVPIRIPGDPNPPTIEWTYAPLLPCEAQLDYALVFLADDPEWWNATTGVSSDELSCDVISWTPPAPLTAAAWSTTVQNNLTVRDVPTGITVVEGTWTLLNSDWLELSSVDRSTNEIVSTESSSWGAIKASFR